MKYVLTTIILLAAGICAQAQPGTLNLSFGDSGKVLTYYDNSNQVQCYASALQNDNKILAAGFLNSNGFDNFLVQRYLPNGILDNSFGDNGSVVIDFGYGGERANDVAIQTDGKIVVTGYGVTGFFDPVRDIVTARLNTDGSPDSSFGEGGKVFTDINGYEENGTAITIQDDGKILVGGIYKGYSFLLLRYNTDGTIDSSFADNGNLILTLSGAFTLRSLVVQPDGKILAGGAISRQTVQFAIIRLNTNGSFDSSFGAGGFVYSKFTDYGDQLFQLLLQADSKIVGIGRTGLYSSYIKDKNIIAARYNIGGTFDSSFGVAGLSTIHFNDTASGAFSGAVQQGGKLIIGGYAGPDFAVMRLGVNGSLDSSFGTNGSTLTDFNGMADQPYGVLIQSGDGNIILAGSSMSGNLDSFAVTMAGYNKDGRRQILITKLRRWWQHHNGISWDDMPGTKNYAVQRSTNGMNWNTIFSSSRSSNNQQPVSNSYADASPLPGTNYYRLQTTSVDGAVAYSNVIAIGNENSSISLSPNPAKNVLQISGLSSSENLPTGRQAKIMVVDLGGNVALSVQPSALSGTYRLNIATLKPGNYMLRIESNGAVVTKQFVKE